MHEGKQCLFPCDVTIKSTSSFIQINSCNLPYTFCEKIGKEIKDISDEIPFEIPDSWEWVRCSTLGAIIRGSGIKRTETVERGLPCVRYGELYTTYNTSFTETISFIPKELFEQCKQISCGNVLFTLTGENKPDIAKTVAYLGDSPVAIGGDLAYWTHHGMNPLYLVYFMSSPYAIGRKVNLATGDIIVHISGDKVGSFLIPVPPLAEQDRIVAQINELETIIQEYHSKEQAVSALNTSFPEALKKSILQEAVQGKLVPQNPDDEPASVLLERIRAEKQALIKAGKIKRDKHESVIITRDKIPYEIIDGKERCIADEVPFEIPESWHWCRLKTLGVFSSGKTPSMSEPSFWNGTIPWVSSKDMKKSIIIDSEMHITSLAAESMQIYPAGTLLLVARSGILRRLLPLCVLGVDSTINQDFTLYDLSLSAWLYYAIKAFEPYILKELVKSITTVESLKFDEFASMLIPIPPFNEQQQIIESIKKSIKLLSSLVNDTMFML